MKKFSCGLLALALLLTTMHYFPKALATENSTAIIERTEEIPEAELSPSIESELKAYHQTNRFIVRSMSPIKVGDVLGENICISSRPLQTNCDAIDGFSVIELNELVSPDAFVNSIQDHVLDIYPDSCLNFASLSGNEDNSVMQAIYSLNENLYAAQETATGQDVLIALLDNGVDLSHKDLQGHLISGWDIFHSTPNTNADGVTFGEAHGTHIAGIIASVAPNAQIMPIQISEYGVAYISTVIEGIKYAEDHGAVIANCSWTTEQYNPLLETVMANSSLFFVAAAGNDGRYIDKVPVYPASFGLDNVISVTSIGQDGQLSYFSSFGKNVDIAAWGDEIEGLKPGNDYGTLSGTSMAAAYVSGAAALAISAGVDTVNLKTILKESADELENMEGYISDGNVLNFYNLVNGLIPNQKVRVPDTTLYSSRNGKIIDIHGGSYHYNVLTSAGEIFSWGQGICGQLCNGSRTDSKTPVRSGFTYNNNFMYDAEGNHAHLCGGEATVFLVSPNGESYGWGSNSYKQINTSIYPGAYAARPCYILQPKVKDVAAGGSFALYQTTDGRIFRKGDDLGYKTGTPNSDAPYTELTEYMGAKKVAAANSLVMILMDSGEVYAWGILAKNLDTEPFPRVYEPVSLVEKDNRYKDIAGASLNGVLLTTNNCINTTENRYNCINLGTYVRRVIAKRCEVVQIECGDSVEAILDTDGKVWVSGKNDYGQAGHGSVSDWTFSANASLSPVPGLSNIVKIAATNHGFAALQDDGTVWTWGSNMYGELGTGSSEYYSATPVRVAFPKTYGRISSLNKIPKLLVPFETAAEDLTLPTTVTAVLTDGTTEEIPVAWDLTGYDPHEYIEAQTFTGTLTLPDDLLNPLELVPELSIKVRGPKSLIDSVPVLTQEVNQNIYLDTANKTHAYGTPDTVSLPETVTVALDTGDTAELSVVWNTDEYEPSRTGVQTVTGEFVIPDESDIENPQKLEPSMEITVLPKHYEVWEATPLTISVNVMTGSTLAEISTQMKREGKSELSVRVADLDSDVELLTFCDVILDEDDNPNYSSIQNTPGIYELTARLPANFTPLADDIPGPITVTIVSAPVDIAAVELARMDAPQSVRPQNLNRIPTQVNATLANGVVIPVDVEWDWREYAMAIDSVGEHIVLGSLVNLPCMAQQPDGKEIKATMVVNVIPVNYTVTNLKTDPLFEGDAGLTLEELTVLLKPTLTLEIASLDHDPVITTEYEVNVAFETEKNPDFDPLYSDTYIVSGTLKLPPNISCPAGNAYDEMILQTNAVEVISVEPSYAVTVEGTAFEDITGLPNQVVITLSCAGEDGVNKTISSGVDWGTGDGYDSFPTVWDEDGTAIMEVIGTLADYPQYVNGAGVQAKLYITVTQAFDLIGIVPNRFPATGAMDVKLGSSIEDIYNLLDTHSVELTLKNSRGQTSTVDVTFQLREGDNPDYDPMTLGTYTLKAYIPLEDEICNPDQLGVEIVVKTMKYNITNTKVTRVTGVVSGTPFSEIGLPNTASIVRSDGENEDIPVTWDGSKYNPTKIGSQVVRGTLIAPLPVHLENPNNRQPNAVVTIVDPSAQILSMEQLFKNTAMFNINAYEEENESFYGLEEYCYLAEILHKDGTITTEVISVFVEVDE